MRPVLVSVLAGAWFLLAVLGAIGAVLVLSRSTGTAEQRIFAAVSLLLAALAGAGAFGLLRRKPRARALLATTGLFAFAASAFFAYRAATDASAPAASLASAGPDAANALVLFRAGSAVAFLLSSIPLLVALGFLRHPSVRAWLGIPARPRRTPDPILLVGGAALLVAGGAVLFSKDRSRPAPAKADAAARALDPLETFLWSDQPVAFPPPPAPFTRERYAEGGRKGVSFTRYAVPPTRITVAEAALEPAPNTPEEAIARLRLTKETFKSADFAEVGDPVPAAVSNAPGYQTDYTIRERSMEHRGREIVALAGRRVFVFTFLGRDADLPLFERLVASVRFPAPGSRGGDATGGLEVPAAASPAGEETDLRVGEHHVRARIPDGWERVDYGAKQEIRRGETRIALVDGGALPPGTGPANLEDDWLVQRALRLFGHDARRWEVGARSRVASGDVEALAVETRDPLSHVPHARCWVFVNGGRLLAVGPVLGRFEAASSAVDAVARSVRFPG